MRTTQIIGLNSRAQAYIAGASAELSGENYAGMFDEEFALRKFTFPDGRTFFERLQADPWSSGPCAFFALQDETGVWLIDSKWTEAEIADALGEETFQPPADDDPFFVEL